MKTKLIIMLLCTLFISCTQIKENQMQKDAEKFIEVSVNASLLNMTDFLIYSKAIEDKYKGDDLVMFMNILRTTVKEKEEKEEKGEDVGMLGLMYLFDK